jgi:GNAT superfamily N-acetyltransferase
MQVRPATPDRWSDIITVFGRRGDDPSSCWCRRFLDPAPLQGEASDHREALRNEVAHAVVPPGLIAYIDDHPVGWSRVGPRAAFPGVVGNRALARLFTNEPGVWWVACFVVGARHRRSGVGSALLKAAVQFAADHGATAVEGHPVDVAALSATRVGASAVFTGTMAMFVAAGFTEIGRTYASRPMMRRSLSR